MAQQLIGLVEQFCIYQRKQRGRTEGGVKIYRWNLEQFLGSVKAREGRLARIADLTTPTVQAWLDEMAAGDLGVNTLRCRLSTLSSFCGWLVKRGHLAANPTVPIDRPPREAAMPTVAGPAIMDALVEAAKRRGRPRDQGWGLRGVRMKGGKTQDIPLPTAVMAVLKLYVEHVLTPECEKVTLDTPLFWSTWGRRRVGRTRQPMAGKNIWRLCKTYGRLIGYPELRPHALRHGVAVEVLEQRHDLEEVRALLGHARIDTTQIYTRIRPPQLRRAVAFYDQAARRMLAG